MNFKLLAATLLTPISILSCTNTPAYIDQGYTYTHHIQNDTIMPEDGDVVYFQVDAFLDDQLFQSSRSKDQPAKLRMRDLATVPQPSPIETGLMLMAVGDSLSIFDQVDSIYQFPVATYLRYDLKMLAIDQKVNYENKPTAFNQ